ncbi:hypothetical protein SAMN02745753_02296 [Marinomonas polaris DSM 16579]|uniref:Uncharacterized protein n=1 Tax=Marinomonas polaris DSM 16579 TaxID=1122206 RepID=A0A1M5CZG8_9GAMM|nr:hypothetical protein SAMN02745753_02296 [Marinomonas polaris DSM 16579]
MTVDCDVSLGVDLTNECNASFNASINLETSMSRNKVINTKKREMVMPAFLREPVVWLHPERDIYNVI